MNPILVSTIVKLHNSLTLPIGQISLKQTKSKRLCTSASRGMDLIESERICSFLVSV